MLTTILAAFYLGLSGDLTLPQGGSDLRRVGGAALTCGTELTENSALEGALGWQENYASLAAQGLVHFSAWELYDRFFGFSPFDPFVTGGVKGWVGNRPGQVGPKIGVGAFYYLDDHWAVRVESEATLGLDRSVEMIYSVSAGLTYTF